MVVHVLPKRTDKEELSMHRILLVIGIPALAIAAAVAMYLSRPEPPKKEQINLDPVVEVFELEAMTAQFEVQSQGTVRPRTETILSSEVSGTITTISPKFVAGGVFSANEVLMRIDPVNYLAAVEQAEAVLNQRQIEYDGASKLRLQGYRAESELASAAAALATAKAELSRANRNLERTYIRLPYEGMVRSKEADLGQFVNPGTRLGVTFATDFAEVRLPLTDRDLAFVELPRATSKDAAGPSVRLSSIQKGQPVDWQAQIVRSEGVVDEASRVTYAVARIADPYFLHSEGASLPMGTFVSATIEGASADNVIQISRQYVRGSDEIVIVDDNNKLDVRRVNILRADADFIYVTTGVESGERILSTALQSPVNGMSVRIAGEQAIKRDATASPAAAGE
jgi:RND family efflux transporter MFP subunit